MQRKNAQAVIAEHRKVSGKVICVVCYSRALKKRRDHCLCEKKSAMRGEHNVVGVLEPVYVVLCIPYLFIVPNKYIFVEWRSLLLLSASHCSHQVLKFRSVILELTKKILFLFLF